jgi:type IV pilus assembly protein PilC
VIASVRGGEKGGFLEIVLDEIALEYEQEVAFYKGMWLAKWGVAQGIAAIAIAQPVFPHLFPEPHLDVYLKLLFLRNIPIAIAVFLLSRLFLHWLRQPAQTDLRDAWMLKIPAFGDLARQRSLAAFVRMLRKLFAAGLGPLTAWEGAMNVAPNAVIRRKLVEAYDIMQHNVPLHDAFAQTGLFANEAEQLLATGMVSGAMVDMLDRVADFYQANVDRAFETSRYVMKRIASVAVIVLGGFMIILLFKNYFASIFNFADTFADK